MIFKINPILTSKIFSSQDFLPEMRSGLLVLCAADGITAIVTAMLVFLLNVKHNFYYSLKKILKKNLSPVENGT